MRRRSPIWGWSITSRPRRWAATDGPFLTLADRGDAELRIRGSRFLGVAAPADSEEAARELLGSLQRTYFDATHHCSAWRLRNGVWRANDAGEPSGSAGAPILAAIDGAQLTDVVVIVVRYFGGTKLGVGGLIRAYGDSAEAALQAAPRRTGVPAMRMRIRYPYEHTAVVMRTLEQVGAASIEHGYSLELAAAEVTAIVRLDAAGSVTDLLRDQSAGELSPDLLGETILYDPRVRGDADSA